MAVCKNHPNAPNSGGSAALERALDPLDEAIIHPKQALAAVLADDLVTGLAQRVFAADIRLRLMRCPTSRVSGGQISCRVSALSPIMCDVTLAVHLARFFLRGLQ